MIYYLDHNMVPLLRTSMFYINVLGSAGMGKIPNLDMIMRLVIYDIWNDISYKWLICFHLNHMIWWYDMKCDIVCCSLVFPEQRKARPCKLEMHCCPKKYCEGKGPSHHFFHWKDLLNDLSFLQISWTLTWSSHCTEWTHPKNQGLNKNLCNSVGGCLGGIWHTAHETKLALVTKMAMAWCAKFLCFQDNMIIWQYELSTATNHSRLKMLPGKSGMIAFCLGGVQHWILNHSSVLRYLDIVRSL